ncbi:MAG TPA: hypothetical protein VEY09_13020 [Pyrinomonadaceae bacterium]|nr:hypothetical protein [Pyrinomonadaceae bacterium]
MPSLVLFAAAPAAGGESSVPNYILYALAYALTGVLTGYLGAGIMPGRAGEGRTLPAVIGLVAGLVGGFAGLLLLTSGPSAETTYQPGYSHNTTLPGYWVSPLFAFVFAMLALAAYKLTDRDPSTI